MMARCGEEIGNLAVSLHVHQIATRSCRSTRSMGSRNCCRPAPIIPARPMPGASFEYVMLKDKNDSDEDARELVRLIKQYDLPAG